MPPKTATPKTVAPKTPGSRKTTAESEAERLLRRVDRAYDNLQLLYQAPDSEIFSRNPALKKRMMDYRSCFRKLVDSFTKTARVGAKDTMTNRLEEFRTGFDEIDREMEKENPILGLQPVRRGIKTIVDAYDKLERMIKDPKIPQKVKDAIAEKTQEFREKYRAISESRNGRRDPDTMLYDDWENIFRALRMMIETTRAIFDWQAKGSKGKVPWIFVGCYFDSARRKRPIMVKVV